MRHEPKIITAFAAPADLLIIRQHEGEPHAQRAACLLLIEREWEDAEEPERYVMATAFFEGSPRCHANDNDFFDVIGVHFGVFDPDDWRNEAQQSFKLKQSRRLETEK